MSATTVPIRPLARGAVLKLWIGLGILILAAVALAWLGTRSLQRVTTPSGLQFQVIEEGEGPLITSADMIALHYDLSVDGEVVQSTAQSGQPFVTGTEGLFPGFSEGLRMMRPGGRYRLWVPPELGLPGPIPPNAPFDADDTLVFTVRILEVAPGMAAMQRLMGPPGAGPEGAPPQGAAPEGTTGANEATPPAQGAEPGDDRGRSGRER